MLLLADVITRNNDYCIIQNKSYHNRQNEDATEANADESSLTQIQALPYSSKIGILIHFGKK